MSNVIHIGFELETAKPVEIELTHTFIGGTTGTGKSVLLNAMIDRTDATFLVLDVKRPRDYAEFGADIPLYIQQRMEPMTLKDLLESTERISIKRELPELSRLCRKSKTWEELLEQARIKQEDPKTRDFYKDVLEVLVVLFERLVNEFNQYDFASKVELPNKVNVMDLSDLSDQLQQVVVSSVLRYILRYRKNIIIVIDEAHRFVPQAQASAARHDVIRVIREGRANEIFIWLADQTVTGIDKQLMKQMQVWCLGRQMELNEAERTLKQIPQRKSLALTIEGIQTLGVGQFIVVTPKWAMRTYVQPIWIPDQDAQLIAKGDLNAESYQLPKEDEEEMRWKQKYEDLEHKYNNLDAKYQRILSELIDLKTILKERDESLSWYQQQLEAKETEEEKQDNARDLNPSSLLVEPIIQPILASRHQIVEIIDDRIQQLVLEGKRVVQVPVITAIQEAIKNGWMASKQTQLDSLNPAAKRSARIIHQKGSISHSDLYYLIRHRKSKGGDQGFTRDYIQPLLKIDVIARSGKGGSLGYKWTLDEMILTKFKEILSPGQIKDIKEWLLSFLLGE